MRKNGINRELRPIDGGICAPEGFRAGGVACGIKDEDKKDLALIIAPRKCRTACVYSTLPKVGAPIPITKKHLSNGLAQAVLINSGVANVFMPDGEKLADNATRLVEKYHNISYDDVLIASTGEIGKEITIDNFDRGVAALRVHMGVGSSFSRAAADAITSRGEKGKDFSYAFDLGDFPCRIGGIYKGKMHVCPNMATTLAVLTTDVNISQEMLARALAAETRETLNMLAIDGEPSPNDMVCIMTTGRAGNSLIDCVDSEYMKFTRALRSVLIKICENIALGAEGRAIPCILSGAKSKQVSRTLSKRIATSEVLKKIVLRNDIDVDGILYILSESDGISDYSLVSVYLQAGDRRLMFYEDENKIFSAEELRAEFLNQPGVTLCVRIGSGNYSSKAYGVAHVEK